jgi:hypothetical protein
MDQQLAELLAAKHAGELTLAEWLGARAAVRKSWTEVPRDPAPAGGSTRSDRSEPSEDEELVGEDGMPSQSLAGSPACQSPACRSDRSEPSEDVELVGEDGDYDDDSDMEEENDFEPVAGVNGAHDDVDQDGGVYPDGLEVGDTVMHKDKGVVKILRYGTDADFMHEGKVYISFKAPKPGCSKKMETRYMWVPFPSLARMPQQEQSSPAVSSPLRAEAEAQRETRREQQRTQQQTRDETLPAGARIERTRSIPVRGPSNGTSGPNRTPFVAKTTPSKVSLTERLLGFPDHSLAIWEGELRCVACKKSIQNKHRFEPPTLHPILHPIPAPSPHPTLHPTLHPNPRTSSAPQHMYPARTAQSPTTSSSWVPPRPRPPTPSIYESGEAAAATTRLSRANSSITTRSTRTRRSRDYYYYYYYYYYYGKSVVH